MNIVILIGRLARDPEIRYSQQDNSKIIARYTLAVDGYSKEKGADFISCVAFNKSAEFAEKYLHQGTKIAVTGRIQTGSYTNKDGQKVYTTEVVVDRHEFADSKGTSAPAQQTQQQTAPQQPKNPMPDSGMPSFMNIPDSDVPFN